MIYNEKKYKTSKVKNGDLTFSYQEIGNIVLGTYNGGPVKLGTLIGTKDQSNNLDFVYHEIQIDDRFISGKGFSQPVSTESNKLYLYKSNSGSLHRRTKFLLNPVVSED